jgi:alpha-beta hydrolase superfamily lysophospholipase
MTPSVGAVQFVSLDGTDLSGTIVCPGDPVELVVLVHGGGVTRDEGGFFVRLADSLAAAGVASLRFDLRGHGQSGGTQQELTLSGVGNDVRAAAEHLAASFGRERVGVVGASFSGGVCALLAARRPQLVNRLVLFNPLLDYKKRFVDEKDYWSHDRIDPAGAARLARDGFLAHSPTFKLGRALINEVFWLDVRAALAQVLAPTLLVHGTADTFVPVESSRAAATALGCRHELLEIEGAQHGFAVAADPDYRDPRTRDWQAAVTSATVNWLAADRAG